MTNFEFEELKKVLKDYPEKNAVLKYIKSKIKCIGCRWNDGLPHGACYSCDD